MYQRPSSRPTDPNPLTLQKALTCPCLWMYHTCTASKQEQTHPFKSGQSHDRCHSWYLYSHLLGLVPCSWSLAAGSGRGSQTINLLRKRIYRTTSVASFLTIRVSSSPLRPFSVIESDGPYTGASGLQIDHSTSPGIGRIPESAKQG